MQKVDAFLLFDGVIFVSFKRKNYTKMHFFLLIPHDFRGYLKKNYTDK